MSIATVQKWNEVELSTDLQLPQPNEFIPQNFDLHPLEENVGSVQFEAFLNLSQHFYEINQLFVIGTSPSLHYKTNQTIQDLVQTR